MWKEKAYWFLPTGDRVDKNTADNNVLKSKQV